MNPRLLLLVAALLLAAHACKGVCDTLQFHYGQSPFAGYKNQGFWDPDLSWKNKYVRDDTGALVRPLTPAYFGSTTFLVFTTDAWHLFQEVQYTLIRLATTLLLWWFGGRGVRRFLLLYLGLYLVQALGFHLVYSWLL